MEREQDAGQERVMAAAKQILKSLAVSKNAADDMMHFLSTFDPRLHPLSSPETTGEEEEEEEEEEASGADDDDQVEEEEEEEEIAAAEEVILRWTSSSPSSSGSDSLTDFLYAVDDAIAASARSARAAAAVHAAMPRLEEEARSLLSSSSSSSAASPSLSSSDDLAGDATPDGGALSPTAASAVASVAARMLRAGYGPELAQVYVSARREALAEAVALLGVEPVAIEEVLRMEWSALDQRMRRWTLAVRAVVGTLLAAERRLCDEVFSSSVSAADEEGAHHLGDECFADVARGSVLQLLAFADAVAVSPRATEKLYRTLGMHEALADVQPDLDALFSDLTAREFFSGEVASTLQQLGSTVRHTIEEFSVAIHGESSRRPVAGGEIHPMTRYVLNYAGLLADCRSSLDAVLGNNDDTAANSGDSAAASDSTPSARCIRELLTLLLGNMEEKARLYDDAGLRCIFQMNNLYYVVQKARESPPLRELVGDGWLRRQRGLIRQYETGYLRASWTAVLSQLRRDDGASSAARHGSGGGSGSGRGAPSGPSAKSFNAAFQELYRTQTAWKVADDQLREELRIAVSERVIPAYRAFLGQGSRYPARHVKCSLEDLEDYMLDFFEGAQKFVRW